MELAKRQCVPCRADTPGLSGEPLATLLGQLAPDWELAGDRLRKTFRFPDFAAALAFVNRVAEVAEREQHHPDIFLAWGRATLEMWTHAIAGLSENDFILAAKIDQLPLEAKPQRAQ
ncbi:MAG TPA: 4a-hydroxytetrahydrobiopterin dehydratase [Kofleriaceae bacterium]|nr:4a-hydroxytetrahydrobiopterin dehydratase [Kofleriaceae bacterium]